MDDLSQQRGGDVMLPLQQQQRGGDEARGLEGGAADAVGEHYEGGARGGEEEWAAAGTRPPRHASNG